MSSLAVQPILVLLGYEVGGNPLQYMMEKAFAHDDLDWRYVSVEVEPDALADAVRGARAMGFRGGHCAGPHKAMVGPLLDGLGDVAEQSGVVNLFHRDGDRLVGENTEGTGVVESLRRLVDPAGRHVVLLGAGQAARAVAAELAAAQAAQITVADQSEEPARHLAGQLAERGGVTSLALPWGERFELPSEADVVIQTERAGGRGEALAVGLDALRPEAVVADVTLDPPGTWLLDEARQRGCPTVDGLTVFIEQVAIDFRLWTGREPSRDVLREAVEEFLEL